MSESFIERLSRFTPDAGGLDRDGLLFAAGRASAGRNRPWMALAGMLAATQLASLVLLWPRSPGHGPAPMTSAMAAVTPERPAPAPEPFTLWEVRQQAMASDGAPPLRPPLRGLVTADPPARPLTAGSLDFVD
jgi:hypothetical protein